MAGGDDESEPTPPIDVAALYASPEMSELDNDESPDETSEVDADATRDNF